MSSEVTELILAARAVNEEVAEEIICTISRMEDKLREIGKKKEFAHRCALISTGNFDGGVSSV